MSPASDVLLGRPHGVHVERVGHGPGDVVGRRLAGRQQPGGLDGRPDAVGGQLVEAGLGGLVGGVELVVAPRRVDHHVVDEHDPLAPVVEGGQLADHGQDGVGLAQVVGRHVGQVLDLADHVVAEVADQAGVQRRQVGEVGRVDGVEDGLEGGQHAVVAGHAPAGQRVEVEGAAGA